MENKIINSIMKQTKYLFVLLAACLLFPAAASAEEMQTGLKIQEVFERYGKKRNVTMVELSNEMLETYAMTHYRSITIKDDPGALAFIRRCLETDQQGARKIKEVVDAGGVVSAYYQLPGSSGLNRFILFKVNRSRVITLVYIEGYLDSEDLITILFAGNKDF
jgi:predicted transcriptional regulator